MIKTRVVYICRTCHRVGQRVMTCHPGKSVKCDTGNPGDERSMPLFDTHGHIMTRAPKWWVDSCIDQKGIKNHIKP